MTEIKETFDPKDAIAFHPEKASGKSGIRRGIPASPKKCIGKKVIFTPKKKVQKCNFPSRSDKYNPVIRLNQK
jgi:hypothetical protein